MHFLWIFRTELSREFIIGLLKPPTQISSFNFPVKDAFTLDESDLLDKESRERGLQNWQLSTGLGSWDFTDFFMISVYQTDGIHRVLVIYRNIWSLVSLNHFMSFTRFGFLSTQHLKHSVNVDGFGVCFEMSKKCYRMSTLCIPSLWCVQMAKWGTGLMLGH